MNKEYIEREAAIKRKRIMRGVGFSEQDEYLAPAVLVEDIEKIPAVDVVEVCHGRWEKVIPTKSAAKWSTKVSCSQCHGQGYERYSYCPNCGAIMDL